VDNRVSGVDIAPGADPPQVKNLILKADVFHLRGVVEPVLSQVYMGTYSIRAEDILPMW